jgi:hypothetical protein
LLRERHVETAPRGERAVALADPLAVRPAMRARRRLPGQLCQSLIENFQTDGIASIQGQVLDHRKQRLARRRFRQLLLRQKLPHRLPHRLTKPRLKC